MPVTSGIGGLARTLVGFRRVYKGRSGAAHALGPIVKIRKRGKLGLEERLELSLGEAQRIATIAVDDFARKPLLGALPLIANLLERAHSKEPVDIARALLPRPPNASESCTQIV